DRSRVGQGSMISDTWRDPAGPRPGPERSDRDSEVGGSQRQEHRGTSSPPSPDEESAPEGAPGGRDGGDGLIPPGFEGGERVQGREEEEEDAVEVEVDRIGGNLEPQPGRRPTGRPEDRRAEGAALRRPRPHHPPEPPPRCFGLLPALHRGRMLTGAPPRAAILPRRMLRGLLSAATFVVSTTVLGLVAIVAGGVTRRPQIVMRLGKVWSRLQF